MDVVNIRKANKTPWLAISIIAAVLIILAGFFLFQKQPWANAGTKYNTTPAQLGTLSANLEATGVLRSRQWVVLTWNSSGQVANVDVTVGDHVRTEQVLASLERDSATREIILSEANFITAQQNLNTLLQSDLNLAQAQKNLSDANRAVEDAQDKYDYISRARVSDELIEDTLDQIDKTKAQLKRTERFFNLLFEKMPDGNPAKSEMYLSVLNTQKNLDALIAKYNWYTSKASPLEIEQAAAELKLAQARQEDAQREFEAYQNGKNPEDLQAARAKVAAQQAVMDRAQVIAPFDGTITEAIPVPGDSITAGDIAFRLDDLSVLMMDLQISEVDINSLSLGQPVSISFEAAPEKTYNGMVSKINQSAEKGEKGVNFLVSITLTDADENIKPGMSAEVLITVKEVTGSLLVPNQAVRMVNGERYVFVLINKQAVPRKIRLGASDYTNSQVVGGELKQGDLIILNPPAISGIQLPQENTTPTPMQ